MQPARLTGRPARAACLTFPDKSLRKFVVDESMLGCAKTDVLQLSGTALVAAQPLVDRVISDLVRASVDAVRLRLAHGIGDGQLSRLDVESVLAAQVIRYIRCPVDQAVLAEMDKYAHV
jgi:hypothetical protein